jgi:hypothetical protein
MDKKNLAFLGVMKVEILADNLSVFFQGLEPAQVPGR